MISKRTCACALLAAILVFVASAAKSQTYYVATNGNDSGDGSQANPFQTLARAQSAMQSSSIKTTQIEAGSYYLTSPLALTAADEGETWQAVSGATVILSGGDVLTGWQSAGNGIYTTQAPHAVGLDLAINGVRQNAADAGYDPARPFTSGWHIVDPAMPSTKGKTISVPAIDLTAPSVKPGATVQLLGDRRYSDNFTTIVRINQAKHTITFADPFFNHAAGGSTGRAASWRVLGDPADLSVPGQFAYDKASGTVYVMPQSGINLTQSTVTAAQLTTLVSLRNVSGVTISGLTFSDTPSATNAYSNDFNPRSAALLGVNISNCTISGNTFWSAGNGIGFKSSTNNNIIGNTFQEMGGAGILLLSGSDSNTVSRNVLTHLGRVNAGSMGVHIQDSSSNVIDSNTIDGSGRWGIDLYSTNKVKLRNNVISNNIIRNTGQQTDDTGAIYSWAKDDNSRVDEQTTITGNRIENVGGLNRDGKGNYTQGWSQGIYMDDHVSGVTINKNVVESSGVTGIYLCHGCQGNSADNNVVVMQPAGVYSRGNGAASTASPDMAYNGVSTFDMLPSYFPPGVTTSTIVVQLSGSSPDSTPAHFVVSVDGNDSVEGNWIGAGYATNAVTSSVFYAALAPHTHHTIRLRLNNGADTGTPTRQLHNIVLFVNNTPYTPNIHTFNFYLAQNDDLKVTNFSVTHSIVHRTNGPAQDLTDADSSPSYVDPDPGTIDYNLAYNNQARFDSGDPTFGKIALDANSLNDDPQFVNPGIGDYSLQSGSPALTLGFTTDGVPLKPQ
jgi:parallel beta-helix repeat protein